MISLEEVKKLAVLSRLEFSNEELEKYREELSVILEYVNKLNELDTSGVEPSYLDAIPMSELREDIAKPSFDREKLLMNAPEQSEGAFVVPTVVE